MPRARTVLHWVTEHERGRWAPALIGPGDIPLTAALEEVLSSGLLLGNDRAIQGYRGAEALTVDNAARPGEKAFLNALMDACDDVPHVALVIVMIRSELEGFQRVRLPAQGVPTTGVRVVSAW